MLFSFLDQNTYSTPLSPSERHGSEMKQLSDAFGLARKQSYYLPLAVKLTSYGGLSVPDEAFSGPEAQLFGGPHIFNKNQCRMVSP